MSGAMLMPDGASEEMWNSACFYADCCIRSGIAREYGLSVSSDIFIDRLKDDVPDEIIVHAMEYRRHTFDQEQFRSHCLAFLSERDREVAIAAARTARLPVGHKYAWKRDDARHVLGHHRLQLPVGQGGFHVGTITELGSDQARWRSSLSSDSISSADFLYVYDCGSDPKAGVMKAVRSVVARRPSRHLDMLFVSHFDRDHICGIPHLLHELTGLQVDTIVMPYLDDVDRLIAFGRSAGTGGDQRSERFHQDLVVDPVGTLSRFNPRQILMVMPSDEDGEAGIFELPTAEPPHSGPDGSRWKVTDTRSTGSDAHLLPDGSTVVRRIEFEIFSGINGGWLLKPYVKRASPHDREAFCAAVEVLLRWPRGSFQERVRIAGDRRTMVTKHRTAVARAYAWTFGDKNETSMSLYSGPSDPQRAGAVQRSSDELSVARVGWLGTGDTDLRDALAVRDFQSHYRDQLEWVTTFVLPHHGSIHNFDPTKFVVDAELWVAAAQPSRKSWKHPAPEIVKSIKARGARFRKVGSGPDTLLQEKMVVFWTE